MFNNRLKEVRKNLNMSVEEFANELEMKMRTLYSYEKGESYPPSNHLGILSKKYSVDMNWLLTGQGNMFYKPKNTIEPMYRPIRAELKGFGWRLNKIVSSSHLHAWQAAEMFDVTQDELSDLCIDKKQPTLELVVKICENFNVTSDWLLFGIE